MAQQRISKAKGSATKTRQAKPKTAKAAGKTTMKSTGRSAKSTRTTAKTDRAKMIQKSMPAAEVIGRPELAIEEIRHRAYEIYLARGGAPGDPMADWLQAERELRELRAGQAASKRRRR